MRDCPLCHGKSFACEMCEIIKRDAEEYLQRIPERWRKALDMAVEFVKEHRAE